MEPFWRLLDGGLARNGNFTPENVLLSLLAAFILGQLLAWVYSATHSGLSYSCSFVQSLILIAVAVSLVMAVIGNSIITAFGLMGALALVRFRNVIKDTRDVVFVFCSLVIGMAAGSQRYAAAIAGTLTLCVIATYLRMTAFGSRRVYNAFLRFNLAGRVGPEHVALKVLKRSCAAFSLISVQNGEPADSSEYAYQLIMQNSSRSEELVSALEAVPGVSNVSLTAQEELLEV